MAMTVCRECGGEVSTEADDCPNCGCENPAKSRHWRKIIFGWVIVIVIVVAVVQFASFVVDRPRCDVIGMEATDDMFLVDGNFDYGYSIVGELSNLGDAEAQFEIVATLSTSEGQFERRQEVTLRPGVPRTLQYIFHEPTINALNVEGRLSCGPL